MIVVRTLNDSAFREIVRVGAHKTPIFHIFLKSQPQVEPSCSTESAMLNMILSLLLLFNAVSKVQI